MAKDKERTVNPAAAQRKVDKARAIKKGKAAIAAQRTERLARTNPARLERQITELHARQASAGSLPTRERNQLNELERDLARIQRARETHGPPPGAKRTRQERNHGYQGRRDGQGAPGRDAESESSETDESVRNIPMPRDTPPPIPSRRQRNRPGAFASSQPQQPQPTGDGLPTGIVVPAEAKTVYEAKPVVRDLRREAAAFVPGVVRKKISKTKGEGGRLLEEDELEALEAQGYGPKAPSPTERDGRIAAAERSTIYHQHPVPVEMEEVPDEAL